LGFYGVLVGGWLADFENLEIYIFYLEMVDLYQILNRGKSNSLNFNDLDMVSQIWVVRNFFI
jgi:hypothetical protein